MLPRPYAPFRAIATFGGFLMIQLYDNPLSPYARKVRLALYEKGLDFEKYEIQSKSQLDELLEINPRGEVPAIVDDGAVIYDSAVICAYLEDRYPDTPLLPADPVERARCRRLEKLSDGPIDAAGILVFVAQMVRRELEQQYPELTGRITAAVEDVYGALDRELEGREYLAGEAFSIAEAAVFPHVTSFAFVGYAIDESRPNLADWFARISERPSTQRDVADSVAAWEASQTIEDPLFDSHHLHWRDQRIEALVRVGLGGWLLDELEKGQAFLPPPLSEL
jgi:glutathione S-transferase/RNA polymerase-associated protein